MADGDYLASYAEVRNICNLDSDKLPDSIIDAKLDVAQTEVSKLLKTAFHKTTQPSFTDALFNTRDLYAGKNGSILYFSDFNDYNFISAITSVSYKTSDNDSWQTFTVGNEGDYVIDKRTTAIKFDSTLVNDGYQNLKISGTYGYIFTNAPKEYKQLVAMISALQGIIYASGGSYSNVDSHTIGNITISKGQYASNLKQEYNDLVESIERHMRMCGLRAEKSSPDII